MAHLEHTDKKEKELIARALTALEPDGWRGVDHGLRDEVGQRAGTNNVQPTGRNNFRDIYHQRSRHTYVDRLHPHAAAWQ